MWKNGKVKISGLQLRLLPDRKGKKVKTAKILLLWFKKILLLFSTFGLRAFSF